MFVCLCLFAFKTGAVWIDMVEVIEVDDASNCEPEGACEGATGNTGAGSCLGNDACVGKTGDVGDFSCVGENSCKNNTGSVEDNSCKLEGDDSPSPGTSACENNSGEIGEGSCLGLDAVSFLQLKSLRSVEAKYSCPDRILITFIFNSPLQISSARGTPEKSGKGPALAKAR